MANLFLKQAKQYAATRPAYPPELFDFIASKTARHDLAWDVGTGSGQAIPPVSLPCLLAVKYYMPTIFFKLKIWRHKYNYF